MTTNRSLALIVPLLAAGFASIGVACIGGGSGRRGGLADEIVDAYPPEVADSYRLFAVRCSRCHTLSRPLNASITEYHHWEEYVARMRRQTGSGISIKDGERILVFLKYLADQKSKEQQDPQPEAPPPSEPPQEGDG